MESTQTEVKAMEDLREKIEKVFSDENLAFPYSRFYLRWETNKVTVWPHLLSPPLCILVECQCTCTIPCKS